MQKNVSNYLYFSFIKQKIPGIISFGGEKMTNNDTVNLLKECNSGIKIGVASIDEILDKVENQNFKFKLSRCKEAHEQLGNETHQLLNILGCSGKEPSAMAKSMSWIKTNIKTALEPGDKTIADLITDGCDMGVKNLSRYLNQYKTADGKAKNIAQRLIVIEKDLVSDIRQYL